MATIKLKFRASSVENREGALYYQITHNGSARKIRTGYKLFSHEWNSGIAPGAATEESRKRYLYTIKAVTAGGISRLEAIAASLERAGSQYTADNVAELYTAPAECGGFIAFARRLIEELTRIGKKRTAETYTTVLNSFMRFLGDRDLPFEEMDSNLILEYECYLKTAGVCQNSSSFYMRNLRAIYNRAVERELTTQHAPFKHVYTGVDKTVKRAVPLRVIRQIRDLDLKSDPAMDFARDIFMFSFYTRGMSFVDIANLKKENLRNGILSYRRQKTGQQLFIKWEHPMQAIAAKYHNAASPYLLPIIRDFESDTLRQYRSAAHLINAKLKKAGLRLGLSIPLTSYVARHSWASIAKSKNIPIATISEAMGHDSENTTRIYLASLDTSTVDRANSLILKSL